ncbi:Capsule assembly protein [Acidisarcina polymorpha]|uniref:Capsule assembly protein n=1 Tax=Acidisarcina polymorpha TaxID=2211140 RepID=A0A2Z5G7P2_9BACT|nr:capsule assembly Wzi family protein [Acidisarcina polymorpha]AXC15283.1 Capsule assembly protein [Acidisarcina polymorpha]
MSIRIPRSFFAAGSILLLGLAANAQNAALPAGPDFHFVDLAAVNSAPVSELSPMLAEADPAGQAAPASTPAAPARYLSRSGSTYIPVDSWIYPAILRLYSKGFVSSAFLGMRPWTRLSVEHILELSADQINDSSDDDARETFAALQKEMDSDLDAIADAPHGLATLESVYTRPLGIAGTPLRDSFHVGQTIINDYGRPYESGFNNITGFSSRAAAGRFSLYFRGEYQHAPSATGYSIPVSQTLSAVDIVPYGANQATIPQGPIGSVNSFRIVEADLAYHLIGHEISFGKTDAWLGPGQGGAFAWSNNAENIYTFRIDRVEPLRIPGFAKLFGPIRYEFFVGSLKGHTEPNDPWVHVEKISLKPTPNFELGFERTVIWGGKGHVPITIHTFLRSFFSTASVNGSTKFSRDDPGARFSSFDFNYRLPYLRNWLTLIADSEAHDDINPIDAPRRAAFRTGLYLSHVPGVPKLDFRVEVVSTDPDQARSVGGRFMYWEAVQVQGYTNKGNITGDWIGREAKGGQAWLTYHLSPDEWVQINYRNAKAAKDFIPGSTGPAPVEGGTTQNIFGVDAVKRFGEDLEVHAWLQYERWNVPLLKPGVQNDTTAAVQFTWYPQKRQKSF